MRIPSGLLPTTLLSFCLLEPAACAASAALFVPATHGMAHPLSLIVVGLGGAMGTIAFIGSLVAFGKFHGVIGPEGTRSYLLAALLGLLLLGAIGFYAAGGSFLPIFLAALGLGPLLVLPIAVSDMPVVAIMLNSYAGWGAAGIGLALGNIAMAAIGALVGVTSALCSAFMWKDPQGPLSRLQLFP